MLATLAFIGLGSITSCGQSDQAKTVTLNANENAAQRATLDTQGDALAAEADRIATDKPADPSPSASTATLDAYTAAKMNLEAALKDPESAKYRNLFVSRLSGGGMALCGEVNSKNGFGGYTGFKGFVVLPGDGAPAIIEDEASGMGAEIDAELYPQAKQRFCANPIDRF
ncbi:MAG: hypothetical protein ACTHOJ_13490 [Sphingomonas oligoaromativorans]